MSDDSRRESGHEANITAEGTIKGTDIDESTTATYKDRTVAGPAVANG